MIKPQLLSDSLVKNDWKPGIEMGGRSDLIGIFVSCKSRMCILSLRTVCIISAIFNLAPCVFQETIFIFAPSAGLSLS